MQYSYFASQAICYFATASRWRQFDGHGHMYTAKCARTAYPCRVCNAECQQADNCIKCDGCEGWMHATCIQMSTEELNV